MGKIQKKTRLVKVRESYKNYTFNSSDILIPQKEINLQKWAVIACDQYTSDIFYWNDIKTKIGDGFSTINLIFPEVYATSSNNEKANLIVQNMKDYVNSNRFTQYNSSIMYTKRELSNGLFRSGIIGQIDLEKYDAEIINAKTIKPTEKTDFERLNIRKNIRKNAVLDISHIILFYQDEQNKIKEMIASRPQELSLIYDFRTLDTNRRIYGYLVGNKLQDKLLMELNQKIINNKTPLIVADGNHSLLSAKLTYENYKKYHKDYLSSPLRYALVEIENLFDKEIEIKPIHRYIYNVDVKNFIDNLNNYLKKLDCEDLTNYFIIKAYIGKDCYDLKVPNIDKLMPVEIIQKFIDNYLMSNKGICDYVHELEKIIELTRKNENSIGIGFGSIDKQIIADRVNGNKIFERKTFSVGESEDKRYYLETRNLSI